MKNYIDTLQALENDYEAERLNEFYNQERIEWKPVAKSQKRIQLEKIRENYYKIKTMITKKEKTNANYK